MTDRLEIGRDSLQAIASFFGTGMLGDPEHRNGPDSR